MTSSTALRNITIRKSQERGHANHGWLDSYHSFSFARYYDPEHMGYSVLRVINEDVIDGGQGFGRHPHKDMEIVTYMLSGQLQHRDSMGNGSVIGPGDVQRMTAGTGVEHSEFNASQTEAAHLLQIWLLPEKNNLAPSYEDKHFTDADKHNRWCLIVSQDGRQGSLMVHQNVNIYATKLTPSASLSYDMQENRSLYIQVAAGRINLNGELLIAGDAAKVDKKTVIMIKALDASELILFDLPSSF